MVASDVASRGIDVQNVTCVVNYDMAASGTRGRRAVGDSRVCTLNVVSRLPGIDV